MPAEADNSFEPSATLVVCMCVCVNTCLQGFGHTKDLGIHFLHLYVQ